MKRPSPDKNGNFFFGPSLLKIIPLITLAVFSLIIIGFSAAALMTGSFTSLPNAIIRIISCAAIFVISIFMLIKQGKYVITKEKLLLYGKWELRFRDIITITLHDNLFGMLEITSESGTYTVFATDISCTLKTFAEILTERKEQNERHSS